MEKIQINTIRIFTYSFFFSPTVLAWNSFLQINPLGRKRLFIPPLLSLSVHDCDVSWPYSWGAGILFFSSLFLLYSCVSSASSLQQCQGLPQSNEKEYVCSVKTVNVRQFPRNEHLTGSARPPRLLKNEGLSGCWSHIYCCSSRNLISRALGSVKTCPQVYLA